MELGVDALPSGKICYAIWGMPLHLVFGDFVREFFSIFPRVERLLVISRWLTLSYGKNEFSVVWRAVLVWVSYPE